MTTYIDQHLADKIYAAGESGLIEAVIIVKESPGSSPADEDCGLARQVIERAGERTGDLAQMVRYFPRANAAVFSASSRFIQEIIQDENLVVASTTSVDAFPFSMIR
ncbi:MAG: hypothetical protein IH586_15480 [Anaerolineaceae bacterium]|nr:hypothetical protein [Anaerolineaceae bacterium]